MKLVKKINRHLIYRITLLAQLLRRYWAVCTNVGVTIAPGVQLFPNISLRVTDGGRLIIHSGVSIGAGTTIIVQKGVIEIGANTYIGPWSVLCACESIAIGSDVLIAERVTIRDQDHNTHLPGIFREIDSVVSSITIASNVWIGANAVVLKGVKINQDSVVAAGAIVNKNVPSKVLVAGVPARVIKNLD